ncbi:hypothetical protein LCM4577_28400 [Mesorhizobium sp. LCM 4577]|nr:hypothetical protein LCM4577_28400 [Mesorhizobium sp. LCM 4577]
MGIPVDAYYGPRTARGIANFPISGMRISHFPNLIKALAYVKMAAARANAALDDLDKQKADINLSGLRRNRDRHASWRIPPRCISGRCRYLDQHEHPMLREDVARHGEIASFFHEINLGGTAIGTGINTNPDYQPAAVAELRAIAGLPIVSAGNLIKACWDTGAFVLFSGMLKRTATKLSKICNDLRLLSSGPRGGFNEINLPALQLGSSIMPGKVNPVVPEVVNQVAFQIIGYDLTITLASEAG